MKQKERAAKAAKKIRQGPPVRKADIQAETGVNPAALAATVSQEIESILGITIDGTLNNYLIERADKAYALNFFKSEVVSKKDVHLLSIMRNWAVGWVADTMGNSTFVRISKDYYTAGGKQ